MMQLMSLQSIPMAHIWCQYQPIAKSKCGISWKELWRTLCMVIMEKLKPAHFLKKVISLLLVARILTYWYGRALSAQRRVSLSKTKDFASQGIVPTHVQTPYYLTNVWKRRMVWLAQWQVLFSDIANALYFVILLH